MASFSDRFKKTMRAAGEGLRKVTEQGKAKLDIYKEEGRLSDQYQALGKLCAQRLLDPREAAARADDGPVAELLRQIQGTRLEIERIREESAAEDAGTE